MVSPEGEETRVFFRYERLPIFRYQCGVMGHDDSHCTSQRSKSNDPLEYGDWLRAQRGSKGGGQKDSPYKTPVSVPGRNYNGELQKERTPEGTGTGDNVAASGGENLGENDNGETVHLVGVSGKGDNNTQRLDQSQIQKSLKSLKEGEGKWDTDLGFEYKSPTSSESGLTLVGQGDYPNEEQVKVTSPIKGLNEPSGEPDIDEDGNKAQNMKGRWKKLARAQPKSNGTDMEIIEKLIGTKRSLWIEEDTSKEGG